MDIKPEELLAAVQGKALNKIEPVSLVRGISTDTRTLEAGDLFVALKGERFDGHDFIGEALKKGARFILISKRESASGDFKRSAEFIWVADTLKAYGDLAKFYRQKFKIPAVAITGSSGKTTVKELTTHVLSQSFNVLKNRGTENNFVGVPKTIFQLDKSHEVMVLELGTSSPGEIDRLASILSPQIGVVTQIGNAHLDGLKDELGVREEKLKLLSRVERGGLLVLNGVDGTQKKISSGVHKVVRVGFSKESADLTAERIWCHENGSSFYTQEGQLCETSLIGRHNILNCLFAIAVANTLGIEFSLIQKGLASFKAVPGRLAPRILDGIHFLDDSYNSNPGSFKAALETLKEFKIREKKGVVCGDMLELGDRAEAFHKELGVLIAGHLFDFVIATGPLSKLLVKEAVKNGFDPTRAHHVRDSLEAGRLCREIVSKGDWVLVKGSRGMKMEKVFECFTTSSSR